MSGQYTRMVKEDAEGVGRLLEDDDVEVQVQV
jgi:hypothetical protein